MPEAAPSAPEEQLVVGEARGVQRPGDLVRREP